MMREVEKLWDARDQDLEILEKAIYGAFDQDVRSDELYSALNRLQKHCNCLGGGSPGRPGPLPEALKIKTGL